MGTVTVVPSPGPNERRGIGWVVAGLAVIGGTLQVVGIAGNPPGSFLDESSIAYNAHCIATSGRDEHGTPWPLYFRAFGEYKNPAYIYLLAALFRLSGPYLVAARVLSGALAVGTALALAALAWRLSGRRSVALTVGISALLTPWLFELGRVVLEAALFPLATALFLLATQRLAAGEGRGWGAPAAVAASLALLTYAYSVGRLLAPLLAVGLLILVRRERPLDVPRAWLLYVVSLLPLAIFAHRHPGALTSRFHWLSYLAPEYGWPKLLRAFAGHFVANLDPWRMLVLGDPNRHQIAHLSGMPNFLVGPAALAALGAVVALRRDRARWRWWAFVAYGLGVAAVPASLTTDRMHTLRLAAVPVFLLAFTCPGVAWLAAGRSAGHDESPPRSRLRPRPGAVVLWLLLGATLVQGVLFQVRYHASARSPWRIHLFDGAYVERILAPALALPRRPIQLADAAGIPGSIQAYWHATTRGVPRRAFALLPGASPVPEGALVITTDRCTRCRILSRWAVYTLYVAVGQPRLPSPLSPGARRARLETAVPSGRLPAGEQVLLRVVVTNAGDGVWPSPERSTEPLQVALANHWLAADGRLLVNDDGRAPLRSDLAPGESTVLLLRVNAPPTPGSYLLELDMLQEGVNWFGAEGSPTLRVPVRVD